MSTTNPNQVTLRGAREREGLGKTPERTPPVMGMEHVEGLLEETFELRWEREQGYGEGEGPFISSDLTPLPRNTHTVDCRVSLAC